MLPAQPNQSLIDGLACLQALTTHGEPIGTRALARELDLHPVRVNRLVKTLAHLGLVRQEADRRYTVGPAIHVLSAQVLHASGLIRRALGPLEELHHSGFLVAMGVLWHTDVCYIYHRNQKMSAAQALGSTHYGPATESGLGLAMLAALPDADVAELYQDAPPSGYASVDALLADLEGFRVDGYAVKHRGPVQATVAITVGKPTYAAIGLAGDMEPHQIAGLVDLLRGAARTIEEKI